MLILMMLKTPPKLGLKSLKNDFWRLDQIAFVNYMLNPVKKLVFEVKLDHGIFKLFQAYITPYDIIHILSRHQPILFNTGQKNDFFFHF